MDQDLKTVHTTTSTDQESGINCAMREDFVPLLLQLLRLSTKTISPAFSSFQTSHPYAFDRFGDISINADTQKTGSTVTCNRVKCSQVEMILDINVRLAH
jgi:hypothetical protein